MVVWELAGRAEEDLSTDHNLRGRTSEDEMFEASIEKVCPEVSKPRNLGGVS